MGGDEDDFVIAPDKRRKRAWLITAGAVCLVLLLAAGG